MGRVVDCFLKISSCDSLVPAVLCCVMELMMGAGTDWHEEKQVVALVLQVDEEFLEDLGPPVIRVRRHTVEARCAQVQAGITVTYNRK